MLTACSLDWLYAIKRGERLATRAARPVCHMTRFELHGRSLKPDHQGLPRAPALLAGVAS
jgi:hypothetical protein